MPDWKRELQALIQNLGIDSYREQSIIEEFAQHLAEQYDELIAKGTPSDEAYRVALNGLQTQAFKTELHDTCRKASNASSEGAGPFSGVLRDFRLGFRHLRMSPAFAWVAILSLALGIGANTAIFQLIDAVLLRTLPVPDPRSLVDVKVSHQGRVGDSVSRQDEFSLAIWRELKRRQQAFSSVAAWGTERLNLAAEVKRTMPKLSGPAVISSMCSGLSRALGGSSRL
jgi:putative ABC transport system permease protein